ncbi:GT2 family glycosyltransferase [Antricoccus suffuscus]|uniref:GT2 family glycosyltransferase n=2 Tax=Antricoccus suffuscus TaxID=1629062 RepID=A0A2T1A6Y4_9ACTN|nr:GT2 family glycosyltransferase [Antricoccus suffuscus]
MLEQGAVRRSVVVLGYGEEKHLERCLAAICAELGPSDEVVLVDNGIIDGTTRDLGIDPRIRVIGNGNNLGFAGGCNYGAHEATGSMLIFVNSDAIVRDGALDALVAVAHEPQIGIASGSLHLADEPDKVNSVGNPIHYLGVTWAGSCGEPAADHSLRRAVACATGGFFAMRRKVWDEVGGFEERYFAYHEDTDLSLRVQFRGYQIDYVPDAIADHFYEFSRNPRKMHLVERNRLIVVLTDFPTPVLRVVLPMVLLTEPAFLVMAILQGWTRQKVSGWMWLARNRRFIVQARRRIQSTNQMSPRAFASLLESKIEPPMITQPPGMGVLNSALAIYWSFARTIIQR